MNEPNNAQQSQQSNVPRNNARQSQQNNVPRNEAQQSQQNNVPRNETQQSHTSQGQVPQSTAPQGAGQQNHSPQAYAPNGYNPQAQAPQNRAPQGAASYGQMPLAAPSTSGLAIAGLILGVVAGITSFVPIVNNASFFIALIGLALAIAGFVSTRKGKRSGKGIAIAGMVLCILSAVIVLVTQAMYSAAIDAVTDELKAGSTLVSESSAASQENTDVDYHNLAIGETINLKDGASVTVNSIEGGLTKYDGSEVIRVNVTYVNNGDKNVSFNGYDWKAEDSNGAQRMQAYVLDAVDELQSGELSAGGTVTGNIYFEAPIVKVHYYGNMFNDTSTAAWVV